jgi:drug/metabolite transporter (DMT)-like permease
MTATTESQVLSQEQRDYNSFLRNVSIALFAWFLYVGSDTMTKWLAERYPASEILLITYALGLSFMVPFVMLRHGPRALLTPKWKWYLARSISGALCSYAGVRALARISLPDYYSIIFLTPLLLCLMSHFFLKERIGKHRLTSIVAGFAGILIVAGPEFESGNIGFIYAIVAVFFSALNGLMVRKIGQEKILWLFAIYPSIAHVILNGGNLIATHQFIAPAWADIPVFLAIPPVLLTGLLCWSYAFSNAKETAMIAPFNYSQMLWGVIVGYLLFHSLPTERTVIGAAIIIGAGLYMIWREHTLHKASVLRSLQR